MHLPVQFLDTKVTQFHDFRPIETVDTDDSDRDDDAESESGIVSESVSASSVILMFGGTGKFKKSPATTGGAGIK